jgi:hypothetical protein
MNKKIGKARRMKVVAYFMALFQNFSGRPEEDIEYFSQDSTYANRDA